MNNRTERLTRAEWCLLPLDELAGYLGDIMSELEAERPDLAAELAPEVASFRDSLELARIVARG